MSTILMSACWPLQMPPTPKAVLISLADNANDAGECWPSLTKISERTCVCRRSVIEAIHWLEDAGYVRADRTNGRHTRYFVTAEPRLFEDAKPVRQMHQCAKRTSAANAPTGAPDARDPCAKRTLTVNNLHKPHTRTAREPEPDDPPTPAPSSGALATVAMREAGMPASRLNPSHAELLAALKAGVTPDELADVVRECLARGGAPPAMVYVIRTALGRRRDAASQPAPGTIHENRSRGRRESVAERAERLAREGDERDARRFGNVVPGDPAPALDAVHGDLRSPLVERVR